jgi:hypothetical protein
MPLVGFEPCLRPRGHCDRFRDATRADKINMEGNSVKLHITQLLGSTLGM